MRASASDNTDSDNRGKKSRSVKKSEEQLNAKYPRRNDELLKEIMENISDAFVALDKNWYYIYVNQRAATMFNKNPEDLVGKHIWTEFPEGVGQKFYYAYLEAMDKQVPVMIEEYYPPWNKWFENRIQPYKGGLLIFFQDITERKLREMELSRMNAVLTESQHLGKMGTWVWNIEEKDGWMSTTLYELLGILKTDHEITLVEFLSYIHPKDKKKMELIVRSKIARPRNFCTDFRIQDNHGIIKYLRTEAKLYYNHLGKPDKLIGIIVDISESELDKQQILGFNKELNHRVKARTKELQLAQSSLQALIENTNDGIWSVNNKKVLTVFNKAFNKSYKILTGNKLKEGMPVHVILDPVAFKEHFEFWDKTIDRALKGEQFTDKYQISLRGKKFIYLISCHPIIVRKKITGATFFSKDVTKIIENEKSLAKLNQELKKKVSELKEINEDLNAFTYTVSHDLRAPLRSINGYSSMLLKHLKDKLNEEERNYIDRIIANAGKMDNLIQDLLAFSKFSKKDVRKTKISMDNLVRSVAKEVTDDMGYPNKIVKINLHPDAYADYALISQVYYNLLSNAVKFSSHNKTISIETGSIRIANEDVFYVKDNGVGFDMKYADKIFNVFQRLHSEAEFEGTGVGLAIVKRIIIRHGGKIWVESEKNKGTTFYFTLGHQPFLKELT